MEPFVLMKGIEEGLIPIEALESSNDES
jgi:hypothetical protein